ncbi:MAG: hypothetical protein IT243_06440 [Bacteroidia bacterium]|nr:hypothetical protein [Bacteroidia bacterium]
MNLKFYLLLILIFPKFSFSQSKYLEFGIGAKNDFYTIKQSNNYFKTNFDFGALIHFSFSKKINEKLLWQLGFATNNYKLNFRINSPTGELFTERELVSIMRSNRIFFNINYLSKKLNDNLELFSSLGTSLIITAKNPYDVILYRNSEFQNSKGTQSINYSIKTYGMTGSAILLNADLKLLYLINSDIKFVTTLAVTSSTSQLSKAEINYAINSTTNYNKAIFETKGLSPFLSFGIMYKLRENKR